jgi:hypothetical protein
LIVPRYTQPSLDTKVLIEKLKLQLPSQPPRLVAQRQSYEIEVPTPREEACGGDLSLSSTDSKALN